MLKFRDLYKHHTEEAVEPSNDDPRQADRSAHFAPAAEQVFSLSPWMTSLFQQNPSSQGLNPPIDAAGLRTRHLRSLSTAPSKGLRTQFVSLGMKTVAICDNKCLTVQACDTPWPHFSRISADFTGFLRAIGVAHIMQSKRNTLCIFRFFIMPPHFTKPTRYGVFEIPGASETSNILIDDPH